MHEYLDALDDREAARILYDLDVLEEFGPALGAPHVRHIVGKLWELRTVGRTQHRVFYFAAPGKRLVLLHAFAKKTQKIPRAEIETAKRRMADHEERKGK